MAAARPLDDPDLINAFLSMIGASPITPGVGRTVEDKKPSLETPWPELNKQDHAGTVTPEVRSRAHSTTSSPAVGTQAPPPTPISTAVTTEAPIKLERIEEDETDILVKLADESKLGLGDSKFASKSSLRYPAMEYLPGTMSSTSYSQMNRGRTETSSITSTAKTEKDMVTETPSKNYIDDVVSKFHKTHMNDFRDPVVASAAAQKSPVLFESDYEATTDKAIEKVSQDVNTEESKITSSVAAEEDTSPCKTQEAGLDTAETKNLEAKEDREHLTHFKSWGEPEARDKPAARVRRVTLSSLPPDADLTLVQSLVHGGAIDDLVLMEASGVAYVRFISADACDAYCARYPNGLVFKNRGRPHTVFVDKCKDVDVISGMLQAYIDCGASRCVRAVGADEDWGMGALRKLAEGKNPKGKVENITDVFRNGVRTIVFRLSSIGDAVAFKGMLLRDEDWEACNIQFAVDPCQKAAGVHLE